MKGFIEVKLYGKDVCINVAHIVSVVGNYITLVNDDGYAYAYEESYEDILEKIYQAIKE